METVGAARRHADVVDAWPHVVVAENARFASHGVGDLEAAEHEFPLAEIDEDACFHHCRFQAVVCCRQHVYWESVVVEEEKRKHHGHGEQEQSQGQLDKEKKLPSRLFPRLARQRAHVEAEPERR